MGLKSLSEERQIEFVVTDKGNAMLVHYGALPHAYSWVQLDDLSHSLQFITENGDIQELGLKMHKPFEDRLKNTRELVLVEIDENKICRGMQFLKFAKVLQ